MKKCYIFGAGDCPFADINKKDGELIIAADGGYKYLYDNGISPDYVIGDFDSLGYIPDEKNIIRLKPEKDTTDMFSAVSKAIELGCDTFEIYGATGGRQAHTLANYQMIAGLAEKGFSASLINGNAVTTALSNGTLSLDESYKGYISVFAHSDECTGVTLKGLKYPLENAVLSNRFALGVSNEFTGKPSSVTVKSGILLIMYNK